MWRKWCGISAVCLLVGCQSGHDQMIEHGYPPAFADGYSDGCTSGRHSVGMLGDFIKNVPRYLNEPQYGTGWDDGFRQCQAQQQTRDDELYRDRLDDRERAWEQQKTHDMGRAYKP